MNSQKPTSSVRNGLLALLVLGLAGCSSNGPPGIVSSSSSSSSPPLPELAMLNVSLTLPDPMEESAFALHARFVAETRCSIQYRFSGLVDQKPVLFMASSRTGTDLPAAAGIISGWNSSYIASGQGIQAAGNLLNPSLEIDATTWSAEAVTNPQFSPNQTWMATVVAFNIRPIQGIAPFLHIACDQPLDVEFFAGQVAHGLAPGGFQGGVGVRFPPVVACNETATFHIATPHAFVQLFHDPSSQGDTPVQLTLDTPNSSQSVSLDNREKHGLAIFDMAGDYSVDCRYIGPSTLLIVAIGGVERTTSVLKTLGP